MRASQIWATLLGIVFVTILAGFYYSYIRVERNTLYAGLTVKREFRNLKIGTPLDEVYRLIGPPLVVSVNPDRTGNGAYRQAYDPDTSFAHVKRLLEDAKVELYMHYSLPKSKGTGDYYMYRIDLHGERVFRKCERAWMD